MNDQPYDPNVYHQHHATHYVFARVYLPEEGIGRQFDAEVVAANDDHCAVRTAAVQQPVRDFIIPASCVRYIYVGAKK